MAAPSNGSSGPTSQIPGLSQSASDSTPTERLSGRRVGIFATDSEYVKLAKQGGQKGEAGAGWGGLDKLTSPIFSRFVMVSTNHHIAGICTCVLC